jgi:diacylglycerol diphosphate phosphatase / phosphatidate phosphatase
MWKLIAVYAPLLGATLIAGTLTIDEYHNWYDCIAGALIGTMMAFSSYRMVYASIWNFRFNHIPLLRGVQFGYVLTEGMAEDSVFTRSAGWGTRDGAVGNGNATGRRQGPIAGKYAGDVASPTVAGRGGDVV